NVRMTLETHLRHVVADQHPRIRRAVRLMARSAPLNLYGSVLEDKGAAEVGMALVAVRFIRRNRPDLPWQETAVRIMAIHASHGGLRQLVRERLLKSGPYVLVAARTELIHFRVLPRVQMVESLVNRVARGAWDGVLYVRSPDPPDLRALVEVTLQTVLIRALRRDLRRVHNVGRRQRLRMLGTRTMACF